MGEGIEGQGFCDNSTTAWIKKRDDRGRNCQKLCDVIYGRPLSKNAFYNWTNKVFDSTLRTEKNWHRRYNQKK